MRIPRQFSFVAVLALPLLLPSCGLFGKKDSPVAHDGGTGPFDAQGNYREEWADSPTKWGRRSSAPVVHDDPPQIASNEQPPDSAVPLAAGGSRPVNVTRPEPTRSPREVAVGGSSTKAKTSGTTASNTKTKPKTSVASNTKTKAGTKVASNTKSGTKTASTAKAKPKAASPSRYTVKAGDSLSAIASRNKTSVAALQRANGIKGTMIHPGKSLVIPK